MTIANAIKKAKKLSGASINWDGVREYYVDYKGHRVWFISHYSKKEVQSFAVMLRVTAAGNEFCQPIFCENITSCFNYLDEYVAARA